MTDPKAGVIDLLSGDEGGTAAETSSTPGPLVIAVSSRALFNLEEENRIYEEEGVQSYTDRVPAKA